MVLGIRERIRSVELRMRAPNVNSFSKVHEKSELITGTLVRAGLYRLGSGVRGSDDGQLPEGRQKTAWHLFACRGDSEWRESGTVLHQRH